MQLAERFRALNDPMQARRQKLRDALRLQQFYRDVEDEEDWIREKEPIAASANRGLYIFQILWLLQLMMHISDLINH